MIDDFFRAKLEQVSKPIVSILGKYNIHPIHLTLGGFILAVLSGSFASAGHFHMALCFWWLSRAMDGFDGILARATHTTSALGAYLDISLDMAAYGFMIICISHPFPQYADLTQYILFLYTLCITTALSAGSLIEKYKKSIHAKVSKNNRSMRLAAGLAEGGETGVMYTLMLLYPSQFPLLAQIWIIILIITVSARTRYLYTLIPAK
ncbi:MAG: CDP-alcohol phosphatidyltransferase family protein [Zetaproteobacteria bacterium]|nr:CDP-alcohol phosphatidyltransferase family protein [Zetaproteobacteria bacterium]